MTSSLDRIDATDRGSVEQRGPMFGPSAIIRQLRLLTEVSAALSSSYELDRVLKVIMTAATAAQGLGFNRVFLFFYDEPSNALNGRLAIGPADPTDAGRIWANLESRQLTLRELLHNYEGSACPQADILNDRVRELSFDLDLESEISRACKTGNWVNLDQVEPWDEITAGLFQALEAEHMALVPLIAKGRLLGLLTADNKITSAPISDDAVQLLQLLANQAAVAMEKAVLYEEQIERTHELAEANKQLKESQDQLISIEKMSIVGELTSAVAHELRNPLTIVGGFANLMLGMNPPNDLRDYLAIIADEVMRTESVLDHLLDFQRSSQNDTEIFDFSELVGENLRLFLSRSNCSDIDISLSVAGEKLLVKGIREQLAHSIYQVFRFVGEEFIESGKAIFRTEQVGGRAQLVITVTGQAEDRDRFVRTLKQVFGSDKPSQRLTLMVAGEAVRYHGGNLGLIGESNRIPSIYLDLPLAEGE